jgi:hypothetical protein
MQRYEYTEDWLELDERDPGFQLLTEENVAAVISTYFISTAYIMQFLFTCFKVFLSFRAA